MSRAAALVTAGAALAAVAGCTGARPVPEWKEPQPSPAATSPEAMFVDAARRELPEATVDRRAEEITEMGAVVCGRDRGAAVAALGGHGLTAADARKLIAVAARTLCQSE